MVLLALFGAVMGQGVIWYTGQFYAQSFLETKCNIEFEQSRTIMLWAIAFATPFFVFWGWLSDRVGRKWIMMLGMLFGVIVYRPIFKTFLDDTNIDKWKTENVQEVDRNIKSEINPKTGKKLRSTIVLYSVNENTKFTETVIDTLDTGNVIGAGKVAYGNKHLSSGSYWKFIGLVFILIMLVTMVYGPIAAFLVEMFPTKIRYTSMSLPYHIGNGVFGGLVPFIGLLLTTTFTSDPLVGLWYPIGVAGLCCIIGTIYLSNKIYKDITH